MIKRLASILLMAAICFPAAFNAWAEPPAGAVYDTAPFNKNPRYFTSMTCITKKFSCDKSFSDSEYLAIANSCANETLGFAPNLLGKFSTRDPYKNCALPTSYQPAEQSKSGKIQWPICCVVPKGDQCTFQCHSYYAE